jgi:hypothetical protein
MTRRYEIHNQLTGVSETASTWEEAQALQVRIRNEYLASIEGLFAITIIVVNEDGSWTQSLADENGNPFINTTQE